jgi:hypothetical protein
MAIVLGGFMFVGEEGWLEKLDLKLSKLVRM